MQGAQAYVQGLRSRTSRPRAHLQELLEVDGARAVLVDVGDHLLDLLLLGLEAQGPEERAKGGWCKRDPDAHPCHSSLPGPTARWRSGLCAPHSNLQLLGIDGARAVGIEQVEGLPDLLLLLLGQAGRAVGLIAANAGDTLAVRALCKNQTKGQGLAMRTSRERRAREVEQTTSREKRFDKLLPGVIQSLERFHV